MDLKETIIRFLVVGAVLSYSIAADHGETSYRRSDRLPNRKALVTGGWVRNLITTKSKLRPLTSG